MGLRSRGGHGLGHPGGTEQVDLDCLRQRGVEGDCGGRVDDDIAGGEGGPPHVVETQAVLPDVARDGLDTTGHLGCEVVAKLGSESVETVIADDFSGQSGCRIRPSARSDQYGDLSLGYAAEDAFDQRSAQKPGGTGNEEALCTEVPADWHRNCLPSVAESVYHLVSEHDNEVRPPHSPPT